MQEDLQEGSGHCTVSGARVVGQKSAMDGSGKGLGVCGLD